MICKYCGEIKRADNLKKRHQNVHINIKPKYLRPLRENELPKKPVTDYWEKFVDPKLLEDSEEEVVRTFIDATTQTEISDENEMIQ